MAFAFPLPNPASSPEALDAALAENEAALGRVVAPLVAGTDAVLGANDQAVRGVQARISRAVGARARALQSANAQVLQAVSDHLDTAVARGQQQVAVTAAAAAPLVPAAGMGWVVYCTGPGSPARVAIQAQYARMAQPGWSIVSPVFSAQQDALLWADDHPAVCNPASPIKSGADVPTAVPGGTSSAVAGAGSEWWGGIGWYAFCEIIPGTDGLTTASTYYASTPTPPGGWTGVLGQISGPYPDMATAQAAAGRLSCAPGTAPPPPPLPPPPGPVPPGGGTATCPAPWDQTGWYLLCQGPNDVRVLWIDSDQSAKNNLGTSKPTSGPFMSAEEAQDWLAIHPEFCPPAAPPAPYLPSCQWQITQGIPPIGGPQWCEQQEAIRASLGELGNAIVTRVLGWAATAVEDIQAGQPSVAAGVVATATLGIVVPVVRALYATGLDVAKDVRDLIECWRDIVKLSPSCDPGLMLGLVVLRGAVSMLQHARIGVNVVVQSHLSLSLDLPAIRRALDYLIESACPSSLPGPADAWHAYAAGYIDEETWQCWTLARGESPDLWAPVRQSRGHVLTAHDTMRAAALGLLPSGDADSDLFRRGWTRDEDRLLVQSLYVHEPVPADLARWEAQDVLDAQYVQDYRLDEGFSAFWTSQVQIWYAAAGVSEHRARLDYIARRRQPGEGELREYLYRLRSTDPAATDYFDEGIMRRLLQAANLAPRAVEWAMATAYRPYSPSDALALASEALAPPARVGDAYLDAGYAPSDAGPLTTLAARQVARRRAATHGTPTLHSVALAVREGVLSPENGALALADQGYTQADIETAAGVLATSEVSQLRRRARMMAARQYARAAIGAYRVGAVDESAATAALVDAGYDETSAAAAVAAADLTEKTSQAKEVVRLAKKGYLRGEFDAPTVGAWLTQIGLSARTVTDHVTLWDVERAASRPMASVAEIQQWVAQGLLPLPDALARLQAMGWQDPDLSLKAARLQQQLGAAAAKTASAKAKALKDAAAAASKVKAAALRALERVQPVGAIGQWYIDGIMTAAQAEARMAAYGYDARSIALWIASWDHKRKQPKPTKQPIGPNNPLPPQKQVPASTVKKWYIDHFRDADWVRSTLKDYGYDDSTIDTYLAEWDAISAHRAAGKKPPAPL